MLFKLLLTILSSAIVFTQDIKSFVQLTSNSQLHFQPANNIELLQSSQISSLIRCSAACVANRQCRTFDYDPSSHICRLFEGSIDTGTIINGSSKIGHLPLSVQFFLNTFNASCSLCINNRYFVCGSNDTCQCPLHTFWNGSMCQNQLYQGLQCINNDSCRTDVGLICTAWNTCDIPSNATTTTSTTTESTSTSASTSTRTSTSSSTSTSTSSSTSTSTSTSTDTSTTTTAYQLITVATNTTPCTTTACTETLIFQNPNDDLHTFSMLITIKKTASLINITSCTNTFYIGVINITSSSNSSHYLLTLNLIPGNIIAMAYAWTYNVIIKLSLSTTRSPTVDTYYIIASNDNNYTQTANGNFG